MLPIIVVDSWKPKSMEYVGAKTKIWLFRPGTEADEQPVIYLFKEPKANTGEDWSELVACILARKLGIPCADYELATWNGKRGVISLCFLPAASELIDGTELIVEVAPKYEDKSYFRRSGHTLERVMNIIKKKNIGPPVDFSPNASVTSAIDVFVGYLMLDTLVGNGDRHDQNWAAIRLQSKYKSWEPGLFLAPTFDHAACLGRELKDDDKTRRMTTKDSGRNVARYLDKNRSAFYREESDSKTMLNIDVFRSAGKQAPQAAKYWQQRLELVTEDIMSSVFDEIPASLISTPSIEFGKSMLKKARQRILSIDSFHQQ